MVWDGNRPRARTAVMFGLEGFLFDFFSGRIVLFVSSGLVRGLCC